MGSSIDLGLGGEERAQEGLDRPAPRRERWPLVAVGLLFGAQALAKAADPSATLDVLAAYGLAGPGGPGLAARATVALVWTALELGCAAALLWAGLARCPSRRVAMAGGLVGLALSAAYLALDGGAALADLSVAQTARFAGALPQPLSWLVLAQDTCVVALLAAQLRAIRAWLPRASARESVPPTTGVRLRRVRRA